MYYSIIFAFCRQSDDARIHHFCSRSQCDLLSPQVPRTRLLQRGRKLTSECMHTNADKQDHRDLIPPKPVALE
jgi:hypothetical protein